MRAILRMMILPVVMVLGFSVSAQAADHMLLGLSLFKYDAKSEGPTIGTGESKNTYYDIKLGYTSDWLYLGGIYSITSTEQAGNELKRSALGATAGYHNKGFLLDFSYFFQAKRDGGTTVLTKGTGMGIDLGYNFMMGSNLFMGVQGVYRTFTYKEVETETATTEEENKTISEMYPMFNIGFVF